MTEIITRKGQHVPMTTTDDVGESTNQADL